MYRNKIKMEIDSNSYNEGFARMATVAFLAPLDPTLDEIADIKTAISEAITNCVIHGYEGGEGIIYMNMYIEDNKFSVEIIDNGVGIEDIDKAMEPMYTTKRDAERSGMGFCFMEAFMDELKVDSSVGKGTTIFMNKYINKMG
ncbi:MAG: anti-sigma F factor [Lachnospiraceae bacterium]|nr:anti-sigma F factor [Lachnospiraceae bacterium]